jgi:hypothetical protein
MPSAEAADARRLWRRPDQESAFGSKAGPGPVNCGAGLQAIVVARARLFLPLRRLQRRTNAQFAQTTFAHFPSGDLYHFDKSKTFNIYYCHFHSFRLCFLLPQMNTDGGKSEINTDKNYGMFFTICVYRESVCIGEPAPSPVLLPLSSSL